MSLKQALEAFEALDSAHSSGRTVVALLANYPAARVSVAEVRGVRGKTDFVTVVIPGTDGRLRGGTARTLGIVDYALYTAKELDQVLLTVGIIYMSIAAAAYVWGPEPMAFTLPDYLTVYRRVGWFSFSTYGALLLAFGIVITLAIFYGLERTRFGAMIRAAVDDRRVALGMGINVNRVFTITFAIGSGLAGLGGALGINALGLDPSFPIEYLVFFLIVVSIGGGGTVKGALAASLLLGLSDTAGKYYVPQTGAFIIYVVMLLVMLWRPNGLFGRS